MSEENVESSRSFEAVTDVAVGWVRQRASGLGHEVFDAAGDPRVGEVIAADDEQGISSRELARRFSGWAIGHRRVRDAGDRVIACSDTVEGRAAEWRLALDIGEYPRYGRTIVGQLYRDRDEALEAAGLSE